LKSLSIVIPIYNEGEGIHLLCDRLVQCIQSIGQLAQIEVIFVDDHSTDNSPVLLQTWISNHKQFRYVRLSRNLGSHVAIIAGLTVSKGDAAVFLAGDLQDPPELISELLKKWQEGYDVVWAVRDERQGISYISSFLSRIFYWLLDKMTNLHVPPKGADYALMDRKVYQGLVQSAGSKPSIGALISWLGFKQAEIQYIKESRKFGKSKWTLSKKLNAFADAFVGFSYLPMRFMSFAGAISAMFGFLYAVVIVAMRLYIDNPIEGWASLMVITLIIGGLQMLMLGILGEYIWRNLEESRKRPLCLIEDQKGFD